MMLRVFLICAFCLGAFGQTEVPYRNRGVAENKVIAAHTVIDGVRINDIFINDGFFEVQNFFSITNINLNGSFSFAAYDMEGMTHYTNNGTFIASSVRFDTVDEFSYRGPATNFVNTVNGHMDILDGINLGSGLTTPEISLFQGYLEPLSHLNVNAKDIENHGTIRIGAGGAALLGGTNSVTGELEADTVNLRGGTLVTDEIGYVMGVPGLLDDTFFVDANGNGVGYINPLGIYDTYWGLSSITNMNLVGFMTGNNPIQVISPPHRVTNQFGPFGQTIVFLTDAQAWGFVQQVDPTNITIQTVFVQTANTNITADVEWSPFFRGGADSGNALLTAAVKLSSKTVNPLTLQETVKDLFIVDELGAVSNKQVILNEKFAGFRRPLNYFINRVDPVGFGTGFNFKSNTVVTPGLFFGNGIVNSAVTNVQSGYAFRMENLVYAPPFLGAGPFSPPTSVNDFPGRWEIKGKNVDLTDAGIRGEGLVSFDTPNMTQPLRTIIDAQNLKFNFSFTNTATPFQFKGLAKKEVSRLAGDVLLWSGVWTNLLATVGPGPSNTLVTNFTTMLYHSLIVDATLLTQTQLVSVADFNVKAQSLVIQDDMVVSNRFTTTAKDLTIQGNVELRDVVFTQDSTNFPNLINLTNDTIGTLTLVGLADFGTVNHSLSNFVNRGSISSYSQSVVSENVDITGRMISGLSGLIPVNVGIGIIFTNGFATNSGPIYINASRSARLTGASLGTYGDIVFSGPVFKFANTAVASGGTVNLDVTGALQDSGTTANNYFVSSNSFSMDTTPAIGNLLGTTFEAQPPPRGIFRILWATPASPITSITNIPTSGTWTNLTNLAFQVYSTNTALGKLRLDSTTNSIFEFSGTAPGRALFVDTIEIVGTGITNLASLTNQIRLISNGATSIDIYYADIVSSNLSRNLPLGFTNLAEFFNGRKFPGGGTFHWVPNFNGPNSSEDIVQTVVSGGVTNQVSISMNRSLRHSLIIDMDADGIANGNDDFPLNNQPGPVTIQSIVLSSVDGHINVQYTAFPGTYSVQSITALDGKATWKTISTYQNVGPLATTRTVADPDPISDVKRFYRLIYTP
jgi:hypothetical protein